MIPHSNKYKTYLFTSGTAGFSINSWLAILHSLHYWDFLHSLIFQYFPRLKIPNLKDMLWCWPYKTISSLADESRADTFTTCFLTQDLSNFPFWHHFQSFGVRERCISKHLRLWGVALQPGCLLFVWVLLVFFFSMHLFFLFWTLCKVFKCSGIQVPNCCPSTCYLFLPTNYPPVW